MSFAAWCRGNRLAGAFTRIRQGARGRRDLGQRIPAHSGFREAFARVFGDEEVHGSFGALHPSKWLSPHKAVWTLVISMVVLAS